MSTKILTVFVAVIVLLVTTADKSDAQAKPAMGIAGQAASSDKRPGQPVFGISGGGSGNNGRNWNAAGTVRVGTKLFESQNGRHSIGAGVAGSQSFGRDAGQFRASKPNVGVGASYIYRFRK